MAAFLAISGTSKSGRPIERLIGSFIFAARSKTLRMPDASTAKARSETKSVIERIRVMEKGKWQKENGKTGRGGRFHFHVSDNDADVFDRTTGLRPVLTRLVCR